MNGAEHGLADLARRLRERFPAAIIIVMKFYGPFDAIRAKALDDEKGVDLITWKKSIKLKDTDLNTLINAIDNDSKGVWKFRRHPNTDLTNYLIDRLVDRKSTRLNSSHPSISRMPSSA